MRKLNKKSKKQLDHLARIRKIAHASPRIGKHGKRKTTLAREEAYRQIIQKIVDSADDLIGEQIKIGKIAHKNSALKMMAKLKAIDSVLDRGFGRAAESLDLKSGGKPIQVTLPAAIINKHNLNNKSE